MFVGSENQVSFDDLLCGLPLWFNPNLSDQSLFASVRSIWLAVNFCLYGWFFFPSFWSSCRRCTHIVCIKCNALCCVLFRWWMWTLEINIHCHLSSAAQVWLCLCWPVEKEHLTVATPDINGHTHIQAYTHTLTDFSNYDRLLDLVCSRLDCMQRVNISQLAKGAGLVLLSTLTCAALCEGLSVTCCCPHQSYCPLCCR